MSAKQQQQTPVNKRKSGVVKERYNEEEDEEENDFDINDNDSIDGSLEKQKFNYNQNKVSFYCSGRNK